jgi:hypothetical protein
MLFPIATGISIEGLLLIRRLQDYRYVFRRKSTHLFQGIFEVLDPCTCLAYWKRSVLVSTWGSWL